MQKRFSALLVVFSFIILSFSGCKNDNKVNPPSIPLIPVAEDLKPSVVETDKSAVPSVPPQPVNENLKPAVVETNKSEIVGYWKTFDDKTGVDNAIIQVYMSNGNYFGKIVETLQEKDKGIVCYMCRGEDKNKPVVGLIILKNLSKDSATTFSGGTILDPWSGNTYDCTAELDNNGNTLKIRGFVGFSLFGRNEIWQRTSQPSAQ